MTHTAITSRPTTVLLMARALGIGGSERQLCEMARAIDRSRFDVHVGSFKSGGMRAEELAQAGVRLTEFPLRSFRSPGNVINTVRALRRYVRRHDVRIVHPFDPPTSLLAGLAAGALSPAVVLTSQRSFRDRVSRTFRAGLRVADWMADGIVVNCRAVCEHLVSHERVPRARIHVCHNGLDAGRFARVLPAHPNASEWSVPRIGTVCALRPEKDISTLLSAFAICLTRHPELSLTIVGDGPNKPGLRRQADELGIAARCTFEPAIGDVVPLLSAIDIFVLPSVTEALSNALMEAMACGCACVASRVGGNPELIDDGATGLLFESRNVTDLAACLTRLIEHPGLRARLGRQATAKVRDQFSLAAAAANLERVYERLLIAGPAR